MMNMQYRVDNDIVRDRNNVMILKLDNYNIRYARDSRKLLQIQNNFVLDANNRKVLEVRNDKIYDAYSRQIGTIKGDKITLKNQTLEIKNSERYSFQVRAATAAAIVMNLL